MTKGRPVNSITALPSRLISSIAVREPVQHTIGVAWRTNSCDALHSGNAFLADSEFRAYP